MQRKNILKQLSSIQKSIESLEKERKQGHFEPRKTRKPDRIIDETNPNPPIRTGKINPDTGEIDYDKSMEKARRRRWPTPTPPRLKDTKEDRERPKEVPKDRPAIPPYNPMEDIGKAEGDTTPATGSTYRSAGRAARANRASEMERVNNPPHGPITSPGDEKRIDLPPEATSQINEAMKLNRKPPYKMEYSDKDVELDLKGDKIPANGDAKGDADYPFNDETIPRTPYPKKDEYEDDDDGEDSSRRSSRDINYSMDKDSPQQVPFHQDYRGRNEGIPEHVKNRGKAKAEKARGDIKRQGPEGIRVSNKPEKKPIESPPKEGNFDMMRKAVEKSLLKLMQYGGA